MLGLAPDPAADSGAPLDRLLDDWHAALTVRRFADRNRYRSRVERMAAVCGWRELADLDTPAALDAWLRQAGDASPSSVNNALSSLSAFLAWTRHRTGRPAVNWAKGVARPANVKGPGSRACTSAELVRLVSAAKAAIKADPRQRRSTRDRQYIVSAYTGLRASELLRLRVGWLDTQSDPPRLELPAGARKSRKTKRRSMLLHPEALDALMALCAGKSPEAPIFASAVDPTSFRRDLTRAGIPEVDHRGRYLTFHGLRKTFGTQLARFGVGQRAAQALLDHADANTTARIYQDADLLPLFVELCKVPRIKDLGGDRRGDARDYSEKDLTDHGGIGDTDNGESAIPKQHARIPVAGSSPPFADSPSRTGREPATGERGRGPSHDGLSPAIAPVGVEPTGDLERLLIAALQCGIQAFAGALRNGAARANEQAI